MPIVLQATRSVQGQLLVQCIPIMKGAMSTMGLVPSTEPSALASMVDEWLRLQQQLEEVRSEPGGFHCNGGSIKL